jgi:hypothetical protein
MFPQRISTPLILITGLLLLSGCVSFREGTSVAWPIADASGKRSISLLISSETIMNGQRISLPQRDIGPLEATIAKSYKDSGLFSEVHIGAADSDYRAEVHVLTRSHFNELLQFLSAVTLTLVPCNSHSEFAIVTTFKNRELKPLETFERRDRETTWIQTFLIFVMPFHRSEVGVTRYTLKPMSVENAILYDLNRSIVSEAHNLGLLQ